MSEPEPEPVPEPEPEPVQNSDLGSTATVSGVGALLSAFKSTPAPGAPPRRRPHRRRTVCLSLPLTQSANFADDAASGPGFPAFGMTLGQRNHIRRVNRPCRF